MDITFNVNTCCCSWSSSYTKAIFNEANKKKRFNLSHLLLIDLNEFSMNDVLNIDDFFHLSLLSLILLKYQIIQIIQNLSSNIRSTNTIVSIRPWIFSAIQLYCPKSSLLFIYSDLTMNRISIYICLCIPELSIDLLTLFD